MTDDPFDQVAAQLRGNLVLFQDFRFTEGDYSGTCARDLYILDLTTMNGRRITTVPWHWSGMLGDGGMVLAKLRTDGFANSTAKLYLFDLVAMGILDSTGQHVLP